MGGWSDVVSEVTLCHVFTYLFLFTLKKKTPNFFPSSSFADRTAVPCNALLSPTTS